jgi:Ca2+-binding RTX toxin-like protein
MWRITTLTLVAAVLLALTAGVALASTIACPHPDPTDDTPAYDCKGTLDDDTVNGTPGPDYMTGVEGNDTLNGNAGEDKIDALEGKDTVSGGPGNDTIAANDGIKGDDIRCGKGSRDIAYSDKGDSVSSDCEWRRSYDTPLYCSFGGGPPWTGPNSRWHGGEPDDWPWTIPWVGEKIIWCINGTPRDDKKLDGTTGHSDLIDSIWADKGDDTLNGGLGPNFLEGWSGNDILKGGAGTDFLFGDSSENPGSGSDNPNDPPPSYFKQAGEDKIYGGPGNDYIGAIDNKKDTISCGGGNDFVHLDKRGEGGATVTDKLANDCETILTSTEDSNFYCRLFGHRKKGR